MLSDFSSTSLSWRKAALFAGILGSLLLATVASANNDELSKFVEATEKGLSEATLIKMAKAAGKTYQLSREESAALIRSGVSIELIRALTHGKSPSSAAIRMAAKRGPDWWGRRPAPALRELSDEDHDLERFEGREDDLLAIRNGSTQRSGPKLAILTTNKSKGSMGLEGPWYVDGHQYWTYVDGFTRMAFAVRKEGRLTLLCVSIINSGASQVTVFPNIFRLAVSKWEGFSEVQQVSGTKVAQKARNRMMWGQMFAAMTSQAIAGVEQSNLNTTERAAVGAVRGFSDFGAQAMNSQFQNEYARSMSLAEMVLRVNTLGKGQNVSGVLIFDHEARSAQSFRLLFEGIDGPVAIDLRTRDE